MRLGPRIFCYGARCVLHTCFDIHKLMSCYKPSIHVYAAHTDRQINVGAPSTFKYSKCMCLCCCDTLICQRWWEENQHNEQSLTSSASQWCSSLTLQHLQREQKQAEVKNTLPLAEKCKQAAGEAVSHLDTCPVLLPLPPSFGFSSATDLSSHFHPGPAPVLSHCRPTGNLPDFY